MQRPEMAEQELVKIVKKKKEWESSRSRWEKGRSHETSDKD